MKRPRRKLYCWLKSPAEWCLGRYPPDIAIGPYMTFASMAEAEQAAAASRYDVVWCGDALRTREQLLHKAQ